jgi:hypothetical protein
MAESEVFVNGATRRTTGFIRKKYQLGDFMSTSHFFSLRAVAACCALLLLGTLGLFSRTYADDHEHEGGDEARIRRGFEIAPVPLNLANKDRDLVGLGSYLVNALASCDDCHSTSPAAQYAPGGNPYFKGNPPKVVNQATYLAGGRNFGSLIPGTPSIVSRNLTPDKTGRPVGGRSFAEFLQIFRTGEDLDHLHPNCSATVTTNCFPAHQPFNGDLLQIMPWPVYQSLKEHDVRAIYEYLSAIPCIAGPATGVLHNDCT